MKKMFFITSFCVLLVLVGYAFVFPKIAPELPCVRHGSFPEALNADYDINRSLVDEEFCDDALLEEIDNIKKQHPETEGNIDRNCALEIAMVVVKHKYDEDFFKKPSYYGLSMRPDLNAYLIRINQEKTGGNPNVLRADNAAHIVIDADNGAVLAYWVQ